MLYFTNGQQITYKHAAELVREALDHQGMPLRIERPDSERHVMPTVFPHEVDDRCEFTLLAGALEGWYWRWSVLDKDWIKSRYVPDGIESFGRKLTDVSLALLAQIDQGATLSPRERTEHVAYMLEQLEENT